jgi:CheY-like chemotaxis protein
MPGTPDSPLRILVVDDEPPVRFVLRVILELDGYHVVEAAEGAEALACLKEHPADLVVTDFMMPVMDGGELIERIRGDAELAGIPVLMISASSRAPDRAQADAFLVKPFEPDEVRAEVARMMGRS